MISRFVVVVRTATVDATVAFYRDVLGGEVSGAHGRATFVQIGPGVVEVLADDPNAPTREGPETTMLALEVESLDGWTDRLRAAGRAAALRADRPRGGRREPGDQRPERGEREPVHGAVMRPLEEVQAEIRAAVSPLPTKSVPLGDALGRVLAVPATATEDVPPFANTAMDGYALRSDDTIGATPNSGEATGRGG